MYRFVVTGNGPPPPVAAALGLMAVDGPIELDVAHVVAFALRFVLAIVVVVAFDWIVTLVVVPGRSK